MIQKCLKLILATTQARKQPTFSGNSVQENTIEDAYIGKQFLTSL